MKKKKYCRLEIITEKKLKMLYKDYPKCKDCKFGCLGEFDGNECLNKTVDYTLNEIIHLLNEDKVDLMLFAEKSGLKFDILMDMLKGKLVLSYKYYTCLLNRVTESEDEYAIYESRFIQYE